jgi:hypothetical protein
MCDRANAHSCVAKYLGGFITIWLLLCLVTDGVILSNDLGPDFLGLGVQDEHHGSARAALIIVRLFLLYGKRIAQIACCAKPNVLAIEDHANA